MHNGQTADPLNKFSKEIKRISSRRSKVDADYEELARLEWMAGLYVENGKIVIPGMVMEATTREGAKVRKLGKVIQGGVFIYDSAILEFPDKDKPLEKLWENENHRLTAKVKVGQSSVMRTRPKFDDWSAEFVVEYDESLIDEKTLIEVLEISGTKGLCDWRPRYGRFIVEIV